MLTNTKIIQIILSVIFLWSCSQTTIINNDTSISSNKNIIIVKTGLEVLLEDYLYKIYDKNIALVTNHSGIDKSGDSNVSRFLTLDSLKLVKIFTPEHGFTGMFPDGEYIDYTPFLSKLPPIISLYGKTRKPTQEMLTNVDIVIYDIQDVGARFYTYISTLGLVLEAAGEANIPVIILDRPNPIGDKVEGPILDIIFKSFVGQYPIPIQYGMTIGELAKMITGEKMISTTPQLTVIPMENYIRNLYFDETKLLWTNPSPNITDLETAIIYPGFCLFEATNVSEGRGTYSPFKHIGAPWINADSLTNLLKTQNLPGVKFEPIQYTPISIPTMSKYPKYENQNCNGINISVTNRDIFNSILTGVTVLWAINKLYPDSFVINKNSMGRLLGYDNPYKQLQEGKTPSEIVNSYQNELNNFKQIRNKYLIYD